MKKHSFYSICLCIYFLPTFFSCNKEEQIIISPQKDVEVNENVSYNYRSNSNPTITNGRLVFENESHFNSTLQELDETDRNEWESNLGFISARSIYLSELNEDELSDLTELPIDDASLMSVLNQFNIIQVGAWVFKLNAEEKNVYALNSNHQDKIKLLEANSPERNEDIHVFSFDDDIFELLETGIYRTGNSCPGSCAGAESVTLDPIWDNYCEEEIYGVTYKHKVFIKAKYFNGGITRKLFTEFKHRSRNSHGSDFVDYTVGYAASWTTKCGGFGQTAQGYGGFNLNGQPLYCCYGKDREIIHYRDSRCLSTYTVNSGVIFLNRCHAPIGLEYVIRDLPELTSN